MAIKRQPIVVYTSCALLALGTFEWAISFGRITNCRPVGWYFFARLRLEAENRMSLHSRTCRAAAGRVALERASQIDTELGAIDLPVEIDPSPAAGEWRHGGNGLPLIG
jgi:hypothetical protein